MYSNRRESICLKCLKTNCTLASMIAARDTGKCQFFDKYNMRLSEIARKLHIGERTLCRMKPEERVLFAKSRGFRLTVFENEKRHFWFGRDREDD